MFGGRDGVWQKSFWVAAILCCCGLLGGWPVCAQSKSAQQQVPKKQWDALRHRDQRYWRTRQSSVQAELRAREVMRRGFRFGSPGWYATGEVMRALTYERSAAGRAAGYWTDSGSRRLSEAVKARQRVTEAQIRQTNLLRSQAQFGSRAWHALGDELAALRRERRAYTGYRPSSDWGELQRQEREFRERRRDTLQAQITTTEEAKRRARFGSPEWYAANKLLSALKQELAALR